LDATETKILDDKMESLTIARFLDSADRVQTVHHSREDLKLSRGKLVAGISRVVEGSEQKEIVL